MSIVYLNGKFVKAADAKVSVFDRGFLFSDAVYEVIPVFKRHFVNFEEHIHRLEKSLSAIHMSMPLSMKDWLDISNELVTLNQYQQKDLCIYLQVTRGTQPQRSHPIPSDFTPTLFAICSPSPKKPMEIIKKGFSAITIADKRRFDCYIKSTALLPNILAHQNAVDSNAEEAILMRDGLAIEGTSSNIFIIKENTLITPPLQPQILAGITRQTILKLACQNQIPTKEKNITEDMLFESDEVWLTGSAKEIYPIIKINNKSIGSGKPGPLWEKFMNFYCDYKSNGISPSFSSQNNARI